MFTLASKGPLGSWDQTHSQSYLGGSEMTTVYRAVKDCLGQRGQLMKSWYQREVGSVLKTGLT